MGRRGSGGTKGSARVWRSAEEALREAGLAARLDPDVAGMLALYDGLDAYRPFLRDLRYVPPRSPTRLRADGSVSVGRGEAPRRLCVGVREGGRLLRGFVEEAVGDALRGARRPAVFLSGGLDSSIIAACAAAWWRSQARPPEALHLVHLLPRSGPTELEHARAVAEAVGGRFLAIPDRGLDPFGDAGPLLAGMDLPFAGSGAAGFLDAGRLLRDEGVDRILTGDGGDELFGAHDVGTWSRRGGAVGARHLLRRLSWHLGAHGLPLPRRPRRWRRRSDVAPWLVGDERSVPLPAAHPRARRGLRGEAAWRDRLLRCARQVAIVEAYRGLERVVGIPARFPFFDPRVEDCAVALPARFHGQGGYKGEGKGVARRVFGDLLPEVQRRRGKDQPAVEPLFREDLRRLGGAWVDRWLARGVLREAGLVRPDRLDALGAAAERGDDRELIAAMNLVAIGSWCEARGVGL